MSEKEKLLLLKEILDAHFEYFSFMSAEKLTDYTECIQTYLKTEDRILQEAALSTCQLFIQNIKKGDLVRNITKNAIRCLSCRDIIESKSIHDCQTCNCGKVSVDGGHDIYNVLIPQVTHRSGMKIFPNGRSYRNNAANAGPFRPVSIFQDTSRRGQQNSPPTKQRTSEAEKDKKQHEDVPLVSAEFCQRQK